MLGRTHLEETKVRMSEKRSSWHLSNPDWEQPESAKRAISASLKGRPKPPGHSEKLSAIASRRFRVYREDGSWTWGYRDQNE